LNAILTEIHNIKSRNISSKITTSTKQMVTETRYTTKDMALKIEGWALFAQSWVLIR
jgi:hypothetical protein